MKISSKSVGEFWIIPSTVQNLWKICVFPLRIQNCECDLDLSPKLVTSCPSGRTPNSKTSRSVSSYRAISLFCISHWLTLRLTLTTNDTSCRRAAATVCPRPLLTRGRRSAFRRRADGNMAAVSHGQHVLTPTAAAAWRANSAVSKAAWWPWPLSFWPWKWCPSHVWRGLTLCQFWSS